MPFDGKMDRMGQLVFCLLSVLQFYCVGLIALYIWWQLSVLPAA